MERYFFDLYVDGQRSYDQVGRDVASVDKAQTIALGTLAQLAGCTSSDQPKRLMFMKVRDRNGRHVFHVSLAVTTTWVPVLEDAIGI